MTIAAFKRRSASDKAESGNTSNNDIEDNAGKTFRGKSREKKEMNL